MNVKRWRLWTPDGFQHGGMSNNPAVWDDSWDKDEFVLASDYDALAAERDAAHIQCGHNQVTINALGDRIRALEAELEEAIANFADPSDKRRIRELEIELAESLIRHWVNANWKEKHHALEAALREAMEWNWMEDGVPAEVEERIQTALGSTAETKVERLKPRGFDVESHQGLYTEMKAEPTVLCNHTSGPFYRVSTAVDPESGKCILCGEQVTVANRGGVK